MRSPRTAKDDQPGPTGRRHIATGGDAVQSVLICTPPTLPSRWGPRNPGHTATVSAPPGASTAGVDGSVAGFSGAGAEGSTTGLTGRGAAGKAPDWATSRSSGVGVHRQCKSLW